MLPNDSSLSMAHLLKKKNLWIVALRWFREGSTVQLQHYDTYKCFKISQMKKKRQKVLLPSCDNEYFACKTSAAAGVSLGFT